MKKTTIIFILLLSVNAIFCQNIFNDKLTEEESQKLVNGEIIIRNIGKAKNICLEPTLPGTENVIEIIKELNPKYLAEVIQIRPIKGNEHLIDELKPVLLDIESYVGIPYYSEQNKDYYDLYSEATVISENIQENTGNLQADLVMNPFGDISVDISFNKNENELLYSMKNTKKVQYKGFNIVNTGNMQSVVYVFQHEDNFILYGVGGVDAMKIFFLTERIETSFINRIKTFCQFIFEKI